MGMKKGNGYGKGTFIDTELFLSPAFISLGKKGSSPTTSSFSHAALMMFMGKRQFGAQSDRKGQRQKNQRIDDNRFHLTYKELESKGICQTAATRCFDELLAKGFIERVEAGGAFEKHKAVYRLVEDWKTWRPGAQPIRTREKELNRGYQGSGKGAVEKYFQHTPEMVTDTHASAVNP